MNKPKGAQPLTPAVFYILLALLTEKRHGYDIMNQVEADSEGKIVMGPGTLYGSIDRMMDDGLVEKAPHQERDSRRIYYQITPKGRDLFNVEIARLSSAVRLAAKRVLKNA